MTSMTEARRAARSALRGISNGTRASESVRLARTMRWATVGSGTRKARAISSVVRPPSKRNVRLGRENGMTRDEHEAQEIVANCVVDRGVEIRHGQLLLGLELAAELLVLALEELVAAPEIDRTVLGGGHEPGAGVVRDAGGGPLFECGDESVLRELLGDADIAHDAGEAGDDASGLNAPDGVDGAMGERRRHGYPSHHLQIVRASGPRPCGECTASSRLFVG